jgi:hypothetical protein
MAEYQALFVYIGLLFTVFVVGLAWSRYRKAILRKFRLINYRHNDDGVNQHPA